MDNYGEFVRLLISHQVSIRAYIISRMPGVPGASDVLQETNIVLWRKRSNFKLGTNFKSWAFAIARFEVKTHLRKLKREQTTFTSDEFLQELSEDCAGEPGEMENWLVALENCMEGLTPEERRLVEFRYRKKPLADYAPGVSAGTLRERLHRIRAALRTCVTRKLKTEGLAP